jgi:cell division protein FtsN
MRKNPDSQRNPNKDGGAGPPYQKYLVIAAVCLIILVLVAEHFFKGKTKDVLKIPIPERGAITKEVPKQLEQSTPEKLSEPTKPAEPVRPPETKSFGAATEPEGIKTSPVQPATKPPVPSLAAPQRPSTPEAPPEGKSLSAQPAKSQEPAPKDLFPKKGSPSAKPATAALKAPAKPKAKAAGPAIPAKPATPAKPAPLTKKGDYAVQVGAILKDRSQAETVRQDLAAKGYSAVIRTAADGSGYLVITSPSPQSQAHTLQEQMRIQGLSNTSVIQVAPVP